MGLADTNSMLIVRPAIESPRPYAVPAATMSAARAPAAAADRVMLRNPGPATSTRSIPGLSRSCTARPSASSRGGIPAGFASCSAMFDDQSPWSRFFGRSTTSAAGAAISRPVDELYAESADASASLSSSGVTRPG